MLNAKQRYDLKRRDSPDRALKERAREKMRLVPKTGVCEQCHEKKTTLWHHEDYEEPLKNAIELCYKCHRKEHPRKMPGGIVA